MKLGILYTASGSIALIVAVGFIISAIGGTAMPIGFVIGRVIFALFLGLYMLPRGLLKIREAKHESQTQ